MDNRTETVMVRMTKAEKRAAEAKARAKGLSLSAWLRMLAAMAEVLLVVGCGGTENKPLPDVRTMFSLTADAVTCDGAESARAVPSGPAPTRVVCHFVNVSLDGEDRAWIEVWVARGSDSNPLAFDPNMPWRVVAFTYPPSVPFDFPGGNARWY